MKYKLIVLDLDGTLTNSKKVITPRNREILYNRQIKKFPTEKQNVSLKHILT